MTTLTEHGTFVVNSAASGSVVTRAEAKKWLGIDISDDSQNDIIDLLLLSAITEYETANNMQLLTATWDLKLDCFPAGDVIEVRDKLPLASVSSITYLDVDEASQTFASSNYNVDSDSWPARIVLDDDSTGWPSIADREHAVTVTFVAGYGAAADVPADVKHTIKLIVQREFDAEYDKTHMMAIRHQMRVRGKRGLYS